MQSKPPNPQIQKLFSSELQSILSQITKQFLSYQQLYLIFFESNIKFNSEHSEAEIKQIFREQNNMLSLRQCLSLIQLKRCQIYHNRPFFFIEVKKNGHQEKQCFEDWKMLMRAKFGNQMRWFENIAGIGQARKIKSFAFKSRLKIIMKGDKHEHCFESISQKFPKNTKNQIQWSTFMAVVRYSQIKSFKQISQVEIPKQRVGDQISQSIEAPHNLRFYKPKLSHHRYLQSQKLRRNKEKQNNSNKNYSTTQNFYTESINCTDKQREPSNCGAQFLLKSSIQISKQFEQATQKFRNGVSQKTKGNIQRAKSAKIGTSNIKKKDNGQQCSAMTIKDMNTIRVERSNRISTSIDIQGPYTSDKERKINTSSPKQCRQVNFENYQRFGKYSIKVKVKQTTEPVFIDDNF